MPIERGSAGEPSAPHFSSRAPLVALVIGICFAILPCASRAAGNGVAYELHYTGEVLSNVSGGMRRGTIYDGRFELVLDADLEKLAGWTDTTFHLNAYQIHGTGLSHRDVGNLMTVSNIEAHPATRLYAVWLERKFFDERLALRAGQLGADTQFLISHYSGLFINGTFGWPMIMASDLPSGGPAYPLATPGASVRFDATPRQSFVLGIFNGDPAGPGPGDAQDRDRYGLNFRLRDAPLVMAEAQLKLGAPDDLPGTLKLGGWVHGGTFDDLRYGTDGLSLADPLDNGRPLGHSRDYGVYAVLDQQLYRSRGAADGAGVGGFVRVAAAPSDRNLVDFYFDAGLTFTGMIAARPRDAFGVALAYGRISDRARGLDRDQVRFTGVARPIRDYEAALELTYHAPIAVDWSLQPDLQYIFHPGVNVTNPLDPTSTAPMRNAVVVGVRTAFSF